MKALWIEICLFAGVALLFAGYTFHCSIEAQVQGPSQTYVRPTVPPATGKTTKVGELGAVARVEWGGIPVYHTRILDSKSGLNGFQRGKDIKALIGPSLAGIVNTTHDLYQSCVDEPRRSATERLRRMVLMQTGGLPRFWDDDIIRETHGVGTGEADQTADRLARLLIASDVDGLIDGEAVTAHGEYGPVIVAVLRSPLRRVSDLLTPMILEKDGKRVFMLSLFGTSMPVAGMNDDGLALVRFAPRYSPNAYNVDVGSDACILSRIFLLHATSAGLEEKDGAPLGVGARLRWLRERGGEARLVSGIASPGIVLAADATAAARYEWRASGKAADGRAGAEESIEFEMLDRPGDPIQALPEYLCPEFREGRGIPPSRLMGAMMAFGPGELTTGRIERLLRMAAADEVRVALDCAARRIMLSINGAYAEISLEAAARVTWK